VGYRWFRLERSEPLLTLISRWIRLLFGREFALNDVLKLWDKLFAEDPDLELVDMICVAMLIRIRWERK
jgi:TBC1 domain family protein 5